MEYKRARKGYKYRMTRELALSFIAIVLTLGLAVGFYVFENSSVLDQKSFKGRAVQGFDPTLNLEALD